MINDKLNKRGRRANILLICLMVESVMAAHAAHSKSPGATYCFKKICHRVLTLLETNEVIGRIETWRASYYAAPVSDRFNPRVATSSGEAFDAERNDNLASPIYPDGTKVLVWHAPTRSAAIATVTNAGPYMGERRLDVSRKLAEGLGFLSGGIATLKLVVLQAPSVEEAKFKQNRCYEPALGLFGKFESIELALRALPVTFATGELNIR